ncbi:hypothetical protein ACET3Z_023990 [Daucus carota]
MSGYEADSDFDPLTKIEMIDIEYENSPIQILEPLAPEIINLVSEEIKDRESFEFTKSAWINIFLSLPELTYVPTLTTSFSINTSTVPPPIFEIPAPHTTLCQNSESFYAPVSVPSGGDYVPLSLVHQSQLLRESAYDSRFGIPGSYDPMFVLRIQDF